MDLHFPLCLLGNATVTEQCLTFVFPNEARRHSSQCPSLSLPPSLFATKCLKSDTLDTASGARAVPPSVRVQCCDRCGRGKTGEGGTKSSYVRGCESGVSSDKFYLLL